MSQGENLTPVLKLFDPFAILEPERVALAKKVDAKAENFGSLLTIKKDADVVDVLENLFVTPQQVTRNVSDFDKELAKFLDKYEDQKAGKLIDLDDIEQSPTVEEDIKVLKPKLHILDDVDEDLIDELILDKSIESNRLNMSANVSLDDSKSLIDIPIVKHETRLNNCANKNVMNSKIEFQTPINDNLKNSIKSSVETSKVINNEPIRQTIQSQKATTEHSYKLFIETVSKDPKLFNKRRIVRPEKEVMNFTKGANLNEKRIVLPQIIDRLMRRKAESEMRKSLPKKLMLDTGKSVTPTKMAVNPQEMSPRDIRLKKTEEYFNNLQFNNLTVKLPPDEPKINPSTSKSVSENKSNGECASCSVKLKNVQNFSTKDLEREILLAMISRKIDANVLKGESPKVGNVELKPEVLMEDCNKQRLIEFEKRRLFQNFVRSGKM